MKCLQKFTYDLDLLNVSLFVTHSRLLSSIVFPALVGSSVNFCSKQFDHFAFAKLWQVPFFVPTEWPADFTSKARLYLCKDDFPDTYTADKCSIIAQLSGRLTVVTQILLY